MKIQKINKRLWIVDEAGEKIYTAPNFIHLRTRANLEDLMVDLQEGRPYIEAVMAWETHMRPVKR